MSGVSESRIWLPVKYSVVLLLLFVLLAGVLRLAPWIKAPVGLYAENKARVDVSSNPSGAWVFVDSMGDQRGRTPKAITVSAGSHKLILMRDGYEKWASEFTVSAGEELTVNAELILLEGYTTTTVPEASTVPAESTILAAHAEASTTSIAVPADEVLALMQEKYVRNAPVAVDKAAFSADAGGGAPAANKVSVGRVSGEDSLWEVSGLPRDVSSVRASGIVVLDGALSYVRVILEDSDGKEYLLFASDSLALGEGEHKFEDVCEESCEMPSIRSNRVRVEVSGGKLFLDALSYRGPRKFMVSGNQLRDLIASKQELQVREKIRLLNERIKRNGEGWVAGDTPLLRMSYNEKKKLFGGKLPNLYGFDAYKGGVFSLPEGLYAEGSPKAAPISFAASSLTTVTTTIKLPYNFDWRSRHGENWMTPVRDQMQCGSCWAFGSVGAVEGVINMYYNQHLNFNLSEQDLVSCCSACGSGCYGGWPQDALDYISSTGVVDEACFPYTATNSPCGNKCAGWQNKVFRISGETSVAPSLYELKKAIVQNGSQATIISFWNHVVTTAGYGFNKSAGGFHIIFKNSWGAGWGEGGYGRMLVKEGEVGVGNAFEFYSAIPPITLPSSVAANVSCVDKDGDGYCNWGIGPKPSSCPAKCGLTRDFDDSNYRTVYPEDCETSGDEDKDRLSDCADVKDCPYGVPCNAAHTLFCNKLGSCRPPENCTAPGDEDGDGLSDCADSEDCPPQAFCDSPQTKKCDPMKRCVIPPFTLMWGRNLEGMRMGYDVAFSPDGSILTTGSSLFDVSLAKFNPNGNIVWNITIANSSGEGRGVAVAADGSVYVTGGASSYGLFLLKYGSGGNLLWSRVTNLDARGQDVAVASDGSVYVVGEIAADSNVTPWILEHNLWLLKYDSNGNMIWNRSVGGGTEYTDDKGYGVAVASDGSVYAAGVTEFSGGDEVWVLKFNSQGSVLWNKTFGSGGYGVDDEGRGISVAPDGNIYVAGITNSSGSPQMRSRNSELWLLKLNSNGVILWNQSVSGFYYTGTANLVSGYGVSVSTYGNVYVAGSIQDYADNYRPLLLKFHSNGTLIWNQVEGYAGEDSTAYSVVVSPQDEVYAVGYNYSQTGGMSILLLKYWGGEVCDRPEDDDGDGLINCADSSNCPVGVFCNPDHTQRCSPQASCATQNSTLLWNRSIGGARDDVGQSVAAASDGSVYVAGYTNSSGAGSNDVWLIKLSSSGSILWNRTAGNLSADQAYGVAVASDGSVYVAGSTSSYGAGSSDLVLMKYASNGTWLWSKLAGGSSSDEVRGVAVSSDGKVYVTGYTYSYGSGGSDVVLLKYDSSGNLLWSKLAGGARDDFGSGVAVGSDGSVYVSGITASYGAGNYDAVLMKYDSSGVWKWSQLVGGAQNDLGWGVSVGSDGGIYLLGFGNSSGAGGFDLGLVKYNASSNKLWEKQAGGFKDDAGYGVAASSDGGVYVVGYTDSSVPGLRDAWLLKYSSGGTLLWGQVSGQPAEDAGYGVTVFGGNNVYVTGYTSSSASGKELWVSKLRAG